MMKGNEIQDERILAERRKIQSRGYAWIVLILLVSIIVQQFFMKAPFAQYAVEYYLLIGCGFYNIIANYRKGIDICHVEKTKNTKLLIKIVILGVIGAFVGALITESLTVEYLIGSFVTLVAVTFSINVIIVHLFHKKQEKINNDLDNEDN